MSKRIVWLLPMFPFLFCSCGALDAAFNSERIRGSGKVIQEKRDVHGFSEVKFGGSGELSLRQGNEESLSIEADDNILPYILTDVEGGKLLIGFRRGVSISTSAPIRYTLMVKILMRSICPVLERRAPARCVARTSVSGCRGPVRSGWMRLTLSTLEADISGSGNMEIPGKVGRQRIHISGSGRYHAPDLEVNRPISRSVDRGMPLSG